MLCLEHGVVQYPNTGSCSSSHRLTLFAKNTFVLPWTPLFLPFSQEDASVAPKIHPFNLFEHNVLGDIQVRFIRHG